jgi:hypothetical protein
MIVRDLDLPQSCAAKNLPDTSCGLSNLPSIALKNRRARFLKLAGQQFSSPCRSFFHGCG